MILTGMDAACILRDEEKGVHRTRRRNQIRVAPERVPLGLLEVSPDEEPEIHFDPEMDEAANQ
jgi:hypothetical protein